MPKLRITLEFRHLLNFERFTDQRKIEPARIHIGDNLMEEMIATLVAKLGDEEPDQDIFDTTSEEVLENHLTLVERLRQSAELSAQHSQMFATADPFRHHWEDDTGVSNRVRPEETLEWLAAEQIERLHLALKKTCVLLSGKVLTKEAMIDALEAARSALNMSAAMPPTKNKGGRDR